MTFSLNVPGTNRNDWLVQIAGTSENLCFSLGYAPVPAYQVFSGMEIFENMRFLYRGDFFRFTRIQLTKLVQLVQLVQIYWKLLIILIPEQYQINQGLAGSHGFLIFLKIPPIRKIRNFTFVVKCLCGNLKYSVSETLVLTERLFFSNFSIFQARVSSI